LPLQPGLGGPADPGCRVQRGEARRAVAFAHIDDVTVRFLRPKRSTTGMSMSAQVFAVLDGSVDATRMDGLEAPHRPTPRPGLLRMGSGDEHVATLLGEARILVVEG
jgi:hypothetical protein